MILELIEFVIELDEQALVLRICDCCTYLTNEGKLSSLLVFGNLRGSSNRDFIC